MTVREEDFIAELRVELLATAQRRSASIATAPAPAPAPDPESAAARDAAPGSRRRRTRRRFTAVAVAVAAAVALLVAGVVVVGRDDDRRQTVDQTEEPPFQVTTDGDAVIIRLTDRPIDPQELVDAARSVGFELGIVEIPVGPSEVGRIQTIGQAAGTPPVAGLGPDGYRDGVRLDRAASGGVTFNWGRAARPGEAWMQWSNALAPGDVLGCEPLLGDRVADVEDFLDRQGFQVRWFTDSPTVPADGPEVDSTAGIEDWKVVRVEASSPDSVVVTASEDGRYTRGDRTGIHRLEPTMPDGC